MRALIGWVLVLFLLTQGGYRGWAQTSAASQEAAGSVVDLCLQAQDLAKSNNWPAACIVRLEILQRQASQIRTPAPGADGERYLRFFSVSRQVFWLNHPPPPLASKLRELELASVRLAKSLGKSLDLPPLGSNSAPNQPAPIAESIAAPTLAQLKRAVQGAEALSQSIWGDVRNQALPADPLAVRARQDLVGLAESLKNLSAALHEGGSASVRWQAFHTNRIRFLGSYDKLPPLDQRLPQLLQAVQDLADISRRAYGP